MVKFTAFLTAFTLVVLISFSALAMWSDDLVTNVTVATGELDWRFVPGTVIYLDACGLQPGYGYFRGNDWNASYLPLPGALQLDKDVGCTDVALVDSDGDGDHDTMKVTLNNVYPWYYTHIAFKVHNDGTIPLKIWRVVINGREYYELNEQELQQGVELDLDGDGEPDVLVWWGNNFGVQLHPCESADMSFDVTVLQGAPQGTTLSFTVSLEAVQWNEVAPSLRSATISGYVFEDLNGNGVWDGNEPPLVGVYVELITDGNVIDAAYTTHNGFYSFTVYIAAPRTYSVRVTTPPGYTPTTPQAITLSVSPGSSNPNNNFGMRPLVPLLMLSKSFRKTDTNFDACPAALGTPLPLVDGNYTVEVTVGAAGPHRGKVLSVSPGAVYGMINVTGAGVRWARISDAYEMHFDVEDGEEGVVRVYLHDMASGCAVTLKSCGGAAAPCNFTYSVDNIRNIVKVNVTLDRPLRDGEALLVYLKFKEEIKGKYWEGLDKSFDNVVSVETNVGSATASATITLVRKG